MPTKLKADTSMLKRRLTDYLSAKGIRTQDGRFACPRHEDKHPSATVYDGERLYCPVCDTTDDIFDVSGVLLGTTVFRDQIADIERTLGVIATTGDYDLEPANPGTEKPGTGKPGTGKKREPAVVVPLELKEARKIYTTERLTSMGRFISKHDDAILATAWPYIDLQGRTVLVDARFEFSVSDSVSDSVPDSTGAETGGTRRDKIVLTFYYDGHQIRAKNPPVLLYGLENLDTSGRGPVSTGPNGPKNGSWGAGQAICFHEGCKSAKSATVIPGFAHMAWNGGCKKASLVDLSPLTGFAGKVYLYPDDDEQRNRLGGIIPKLDQPGIAAMLTLAKRLGKMGIEAVVVEPYPKAREIKSSGADIVEALQVATPEELAKWIAENPLTEPEPSRHVSDTKSESVEVDGNFGSVNSDGNSGTVNNNTTNGTVNNHSGTTGTDEIPDGNTPDGKEYAPSRASDANPFPPFITLGSDGDKLCFIGVGGSLMRYNPGSLTKTQLLTLAPLTFWATEYPLKSGVDWETAIDDVIHYSLTRDFQPDRVRGCGAWREEHGKKTYYVYHDGKKQFWYPSKPKDKSPHIYIKRPMVSMGLDSRPADKTIRRDMYDMVASLSWATKSDCLRVMAWAALSPFCGALPWRPAGLLTGESGSGKSTIANLVRKLANPLWLTGGESTEAGIRQSIGVDSRNLVLDEADTDTDAKKRNMMNTFSLMRQSTTDDAPAVVKGTMHGQATSFSMKNMYLFMSIDPEIDAIADENRMFRAKMVKSAGRDWLDSKDSTGKVVFEGKQSKLNRIITDENCARVRSFTWQKLGHIVADAPRLANMIAEVTGRDIRWSTGEALLLSAYFCVWRDAFPSDKAAIKVIEQFYDASPTEPQRNDAEEIMDRLLDESIVIPETRENVTLRYVLTAIYKRGVPAEGVAYPDGLKYLQSDELMKYKKVANAFGVSVQRNGDVAIAHNHHRIMNILRVSRGYHIRFERHPLARGSAVTTIDGTSRRAVIFTEELLSSGGKVPF
jgi:putative DNA primase/helicase